MVATARVLAPKYASQHRLQARLILSLSMIVSLTPIASRKMFTPMQSYNPQHGREAEFPPLLFSLTNLDQVTPRAQTPGRTTTENSLSWSRGQRSGTTPGSTTHGEINTPGPPLERLAADVVMGEFNQEHAWDDFMMNAGHYGEQSPMRGLQLLDLSQQTLDTQSSSTVPTTNVTMVHDLGLLSGPTPLLC